MPWYVVAIFVCVGVGGVLTGCGGNEEPKPEVCATPPQSPLPPPDPDMLQYAVRIALVVYETTERIPDPTDPNDTNDVKVRLKMEQSVGTIISGDRVLTHNHFDKEKWEIAEYLLFTSHTGVETEVEKSKDLDQPKDAGTMILQLPSGTSLGAISAPLGNSGTLSVNDAVQVVYYDDEMSRMDVLSTRIECLYMGDIPEARIADPSMILSPGDSGGGMFKNGQLVGNTWSIIETSERVRLPSFRSALLPSSL